jgi:hypothetical protein
MVGATGIDHVKVVLIEWRCSAFVRQGVADPGANTI